jgi:hypothetical protein
MNCASRGIALRSVKWTIKDERQDPALAAVRRLKGAHVRNYLLRYDETVTAKLSILQRVYRYDADKVMTVLQLLAQICKRTYTQ